MKRSVSSWRVADSSPWPSRVGLTVFQLTPEGDEANRYPFNGLGKNEVVVWIKDDPLSRHPDGWSCVININDLI